MKTKNVSLKALLFAAVFSVAVSQHASARPVETTENPRARIFYLGSNNNQYSVQLVFENKERDTYFITLKDEMGNVIYSERTTAPAYRKNFHIETATIGDGEITVNIFSQKSGASQKFTINKKVTTREEVVVTEINK